MDSLVPSTVEHEIVFVLLKPQERHSNASLAGRLVDTGLYLETRHRLHLASAHLKDDIILERRGQVDIGMGHISLLQRSPDVGQRAIWGKGGSMQRTRN